MSGPSAASWSFEEADARRIAGLLDSFLRESNARCALLVDRSGQLITTAGERPDFDSTAFASLAAADFSANDQLASLLGERDFSSLFHQGERESIFLADVAGRLILVVIFDERATLGMVRIKGRALAGELGHLFRELLGRKGAEPRGASMESGWAAEAEGEIDRLFGAR